jgi:hypothetical protein
MKTNNFILAFIIIILVSACDNSNETILSDLENNNLNGPVKEILFSEYNNNIKVNEVRGLYSKDGFINRIENYRKDTLYTSEIYLRDKNNKLISSITINSKGDTVNERIYKYAGNNLEKIEQYRNKKLQSTWYYKNDSKGRKIKEVLKVEDKHFRTVEYEYATDDSYDIIKMYNKEGVLEHKRKNIVNDDTTKIEIIFTSYIIEGKESEGRIVGCLDSLHHLIEEINIRDGDTNSITNYQYEYDKFNNWVVKITSGDPEYISIEERNIKYYNDAGFKNK